VSLLPCFQLKSGQQSNTLLPRYLLYCLDIYFIAQIFYFIAHIFYFIAHIFTLLPRFHHFCEKNKIEALPVAGIIFLTLDKGNQAKKCVHDGVQKIVTILRKNVFSYVDIRPKNANYLGFKKIVTTLVKKKFLAV
jgi:hypothetical protein